MTDPSTTTISRSHNPNHTRNKQDNDDSTRSISPIPVTRHFSSYLSSSSATLSNRKRKGSASSLSSLLTPVPIISPQGSSYSSSVTATTMMKKRVVQKERWVCDVCRIATFDDYQEACRHEETCAGGKEEEENIETIMQMHPVETLEQTVGDKTRRRENDQDCTMDDDDDDSSVVMVTEENDHVKKGHDDDDDKPLEIPTTETVDFENTPMVPKKLKFSFMEEKRKGKQHTCHFDSCEICHHEDENAVKKVRGNSVVKVGTGKCDAKSNKRAKSPMNVNVNVNVNATKNAAAVPTKTAPLFLKHTKQLKTSTADTIVHNKDKKGNNANKTPRTIAFASIFQKAIPEKHESKMSDDPVDLVVVSGDNQATVVVAAASSSSSPCRLSEQEQKAILAEHRAAEFVSKRRRQLQEEKERQEKKRKEQKRLNPLFGQSTGMALGYHGTNKRPKGNSSSGKRLESPIDLTEIPVVEKKNEKKLVPLENVSKKYPPRFPNPSHIGHTTQHDLDDKDARCLLNKEEHYNAFISIPRHAQAIDSVSLPHALLPLYKYHHMEGGQGSTHQKEDYLSMHFSSVFQPCDLRRNANHVQDTNQLWSEKYTMQAIPHSVYGDTNKEVAEDLIRFINEWKNHRQQVCDARAEKAAKLRGIKKKKAKKRMKKYDYDDDDDDFLSDDDSDGLRSVYLLTGETGSGKTSLAHAAARHCQCELIEINTSMERSGKALKKEIEECSQSLSNLALLKKDSSVTGGILQEDDDEVLQGPSLSIILIDEVDLIFESEGDTGFWQSLSNVAKKAKCPIILTASNIPTHLKSSSIQYEHSILVRPAPYECASKMTQIARAEKMTWRKDLTGEDIKKAMAIIAKFCECDLRKIMNEMQVYALGSPLFSPPNIPQQSELESFGNECSYKIEYPRVNSVIPCVVPSRLYSVVTVKGSDFRKGCLAIVTVGGQVVPSRIIDEHTILAVVPPCQISSKVDRFGIVRNSLFEESLDTRYAPVHVSIKGKHGVTSKSNFTACDVKSVDTSVPLPAFLEYSFDGFMAGDHNEESDNSIPTSRTNVNPEVLLERAAKELLKQSEAEKVNQSFHSSVVSCSPLSSTQEETNVDEMTELSKKVEYLSDFTLFKDTNDYLQLPLIAGYMKGSDNITTDDVSSVCGWEDPSLCRGYSDCYVTFPTSRRDRFLTSEACFLPNKSTFQFDLINTNFENDDDEDDGLFTFRSAMEESYLSRTFESSLLATNQSTIKTTEHQSTISMFATCGIMNRERDDKIDAHSSLLEHLMSDVRFVNFPFPDFCWLDYIPHLRKIAFIEAEADKNYAALKLNDSGHKLQGKRRNTRRSAPKRRPHYFDTLLGSGYGSDNDIGKDIGDELTDLHLQYDDRTHI